LLAAAAVAATATAHKKYVPLNPVSFGASRRSPPASPAPF